MQNWEVWEWLEPQAFDFAETLVEYLRAGRFLLAREWDNLPRAQARQRLALAQARFQSLKPVVHAMPRDGDGKFTQDAIHGVYSGPAVLVAVL